MQIFIPLLAALMLGCHSSAGIKVNKIKLSHNKEHAVRMLDSLLIIRNLKFLSSDSCEGRKPGSTGHELAIQRILRDLRSAKIDSLGKSMLQVSDKTDSLFAGGKNIVGLVKGKKFADSFLVISAHYDHLGKKIDGSIYHGADDNASGVACLIGMATYFHKHPLPYSLVFVAFDKEETGLQGAKYFVSHLPDGMTLKKLKLNINMDMIARSDQNEIYACGLRYNPQFTGAIQWVQSKTSADLMTGHDSGSAHDDWTNQSDHYAFFKAGIPFIYIGVEDHPDYHQTSDTSDKINPGSYIENCNMVALLIKRIAEGE